MDNYGTLPTLIFYFIRKLGWKTIRADIHGVLTTFDPCDQTVLEMLEKADIANNQRSDITTTEKSRYRDFVFKNGVNEILESLNFLRFRVARSTLSLSFAIFGPVKG